MVAALQGWTFAVQALTQEERLTVWFSTCQLLALVQSAVVR